MRPRTLRAQSAVTTCYACGYALAARRSPIQPEIAQLWHGSLGRLLSQPHTLGVFVMTSFPRRDPVYDQLLTPENSALLVIDYQPTQINSIGSMDHHQLINNITVTARLAKLYKVPIVLSTVNVQSGRNKDTIPQLKAILGDQQAIDRTSINA